MCTPLPLEEVNNKYLSVSLTNNLSCNVHVNKICSYAFQKVGFLKHKLKNVPPNVKVLGYLALITPKLDYTCTVWDPYTKSSIDNLEYD